MPTAFDNALGRLTAKSPANALYCATAHPRLKSVPRKITKLLVANRSEIAIRVMRAATELGIATVAIYADEDRFALHRFKADESYPVGETGQALGAYLDIRSILRVAREARVDAVHPGYGFLAENPDFADACAEAGLIFVGPPAAVMRKVGNKVSARSAGRIGGRTGNAGHGAVTRRPRRRA